LRFDQVRIFLFCLISSLHTFGIGQTNTSFPILNFNTTARNSALGGINVGVFDYDPSTSLQLPSNLTPLQDGLLQMNYVNYFADSDIAILNYTFNQNKMGVLSTSLVYCNYGHFEYADPSGQFLDQTFSVNDVMFQLGHGRKLSDKLQIGINMKLAGSFYERYRSYALATDLSFTYFDKIKNLGSYFLVKNFGRQIMKFYPSQVNYNLPFALELGVNKKLKYAPIRFHATYRNLDKWNLVMIPENNLNSFGRTLFSHFIFGSELMFSENFHFRFGYNFLSRMELQPNARPGTSGLSWGIQLKIKKMMVNFTNAKFHMSGTSNHFSIIRKIN
jgi:hypothetical protein